ncbi:hypothetical protein [Nocardia nova]|uniref:Secreted protein n=1 Tax=Nocardia nova SH22a TaxID=1415166 RepID=W5TQM5_9NOCA|nr:hypothetical protein [Nocardia nova]AHH21258.1 hypothetical protein NONO_c64880 [Nocardia nova SH22a]
MKKALQASFIALAAGAVIAGPLAGSAMADPGHHDQDWGGLNRPGWSDPRDPFHNDWHCDRHGNWHNDEHDGWGHHDQRCRIW